MPEARNQPETGEVRETELPGVGVRYEFRNRAGHRIAIVRHRSGRRSLILYDEDDPDSARASFDLEEADSRTLSELLGASPIAQHLAKLQQTVRGLAIDWLPIGDAGPYDGRTIGDTRARTRTGVSIVAVLRGDEAIPAPEPSQGLEAGDTLLVVGTPRGIEDLAVILRMG